MSGNDVEAIRAVAMLYLEGMVWGEPDKLRRAFHLSATAAGHFEGVYWNTSREDFIHDWMLEPNLPVGTPFVFEIKAIDIAGDIAMVTVTDTYNGEDFTDFLVMIKDQGQWQTTHKAWYVHPRGT